MTIRPPALSPGDTVMLVSPAGPSRPERVTTGIAMLESWGLKVIVGEGAMDRAGYLAGSDATRLVGFNTALRDPDVRGIICTRGGYGVQRIVDDLDFDAVREDPKVVAGFSDITALQLALWQRAGVASVHAPMAAWNAERTGSVSATSLRDALMTAAPAVVAANPEEETAAVRVPGPVVTGRLLGGNLCMLVATLGTIDMPSLDGAILLLEDIAEPPYKVDRMLTQLRRAGALDGIAGVAVGQFTDCADGWPTTVVDVLSERLGGLGVPVLGGLPIGHGRDQLSVGFAVPAALDPEASTLTVTPAVTAIDAAGIG